MLIGYIWDHKVNRSRTFVMGFNSASLRISAARSQKRKRGTGARLMLRCLRMPSA